MAASFLAAAVGGNFVMDSSQTNLRNELTQTKHHVSTENYITHENKLEVIAAKSGLTLS